MGFFNSLLGKDGGRRFIKRKDSDAGEAGRALEELRGSLYNELRTSDGAKRQQQRFCGPIVAMTFNFIVAVGIIMANKLVMGRIGFNFPIFLTLIHYSSAWLLLAIFKAFSLLPVSPPSKSTPFSSLFALGAVMAFASGLANTSLKHNSVGFYQMAKISVTPTIVLAEFILFGKTISFNKVDVEDYPCYSLLLISSDAMAGPAWGVILQVGSHATSATSHVVLGQFKTCVILLGGYILFKSDPGFVSICGAVIAICGMSVYTSLNLSESRKTAGDQLPKQSFSVLKPKSTEDSTKESNVNDTSSFV
ncbi:hypothetical protein RJ640_004887 [Escallonia rubra]|uniref:Sugar phosphate transporter domain-containing protein n=1 Tax=Escallonia rubra TaxID=112253 RepID=A0AA88QMA2_9ASTE|nr:hypothetical protein RJ640_004887 [Escallonia rubra]